MTPEGIFLVDARHKNWRKMVILLVIPAKAGSGHSNGCFPSELSDKVDTGTHYKRASSAKATVTFAKSNGVCCCNSLIKLCKRVSEAWFCSFQSSTLGACITL